MDGSGTRDRLVQAAYTLFRKQGYTGTPVSAIEEAAGLSPGAGGFYRHFESKGAVLEAVVEEQIDRTQEVASIIDQMMPLEDTRAEGLLLLRRGMEEMKRSQNVLVMLTKVADEFPELLERFHEEVIQRSYEAVGAWLEAAIEREDLDVADPKPLTVAVVGAMANYWKTRTLFDRSPAGVEEEAFVQTLMDMITDS